MQLATPQQCLLLVLHNQFKKGTLPEQKVPVYFFMKRKHSPDPRERDHGRKMEKRIDDGKPVPTAAQIKAKNMRDLMHALHAL